MGVGGCLAAPRSRLGPRPAGRLRAVPTTHPAPLRGGADPCGVCARRLLFRQQPGAAEPGQVSAARRATGGS